MKQNLKAKLSSLQEEFKAAKNKYNGFGKYKYRSAEDILEALKPYNKKYGVLFLIAEELIDSVDYKDSITEKSVPVIKSVASIVDIESDEIISANAIVGVDINQKGMSISQSFGTASSYGKKYALGNLLLIDDTQDDDATNTHDDKKSVNKKLPKLEGEAIAKAKQYLEGGGNYEAIASKYTIDEKTKKLLTGKN